MRFNVDQPTTARALAALYAGNPHMSPDEVESNMFLNSSQGPSYIHKQASQLGLGSDPAAFFRSALLQKQLANTPSGGQMEFARLQGKLNPHSWAAQEMSRNASLDNLIANETATAQKLASLQQANRLEQYPMPAAGVTPVLSPVMQADMAHQGLTDPRAYLARQRMGGLATPSVAGGEMLSKSVAPFTSLPSGYTAANLYDSGTFRNAVQQHPNKAALVFEAVTGGGLGAFQDERKKTRDSRFKQAQSHFSEGFQSGLFKFDKDKILQRERVVDQMTGKLGLGANYGPLGDYEQALMGEFGSDGFVSDEFRRLQAEEARRAALKTIDIQATASRIPQTTNAAGVPSVFTTPAFARLQQTNPQLAEKMWRNFMPPTIPRSPLARQLEASGVPF